MTRISTACSWVNIGGLRKAAILAQVGHFYSGGVGQYYSGANKQPDEPLERGLCEWFQKSPQMPPVAHSPDEP